MVIFFLSISEIFPQLRPLSCKNVIDGIPEFVHLYISIVHRYPQFVRMKKLKVTGEQIGR